MGETLEQPTQIHKDAQSKIKPIGAMPFEDEGDQIYREKDDEYPSPVYDHAAGSKLERFILAVDRMITPGVLHEKIKIGRQLFRSWFTNHVSE